MIESAWKRIAMLSHKDQNRSELGSLLGQTGQSLVYTLERTRTMVCLKRTIGVFYITLQI